VKRPDQPESDTTCVSTQTGARLAVVLALLVIGGGPASACDDSERDAAPRGRDVPTSTAVSRITVIPPSETSPVPEGATPAPRTVPDIPQPPGVIEGSLSYPSEGIPPALFVCAENLDYGEAYCTADHVKDRRFLYGEGYRLTLPVGRYLVFARLPDGLPRAYYSEFVTCGLRPPCSSHTPIVVAVAAGAVIEGIDPGDWYVPQP